MNSPLVIGAPQTVRRVRARERGALGLVDSSAATPDQAVPIEDRMHGADRRAVHLRVLPAQAFTDLRSTPAGVLLFELDDGLLDLEGQLSGVAIGSPGAIRQ